MPQRAVLRAKGAEPVSKREANKLDKLRRIQQAAHELFLRHGYDNTTMREIASRAEVALGTLFLYASNKRDLLFLIANETMEGVVDEATSLVRSRRGVVHNLTLIAGAHFRTFGRRPELFRLVLRELLFYDTGDQGQRAVRNRARLLGLIRSVVIGGVDAGEVATGTDPDLLARLFFAILQAEIRIWIAAEKRDLGSGLAAFWAAVSLVLNGVSVKPVAPRVSPAERRAFLARLTSAPPCDEP